jgi:hypothetical protein
MEYYRQRVEKLLLRLTFEAEAWAESSTRKLGQYPLLREPGHRRHRSPLHTVQMATAQGVGAIEGASRPVAA